MALPAAQSSDATGKTNSIDGLSMKTSRSHPRLGEPYRYIALVSRDPTSVNTELTAVAIFDNPAIANRAMNAATNAYSTISWPLSSARNAESMLAELFMITLSACRRVSESNLDRSRQAGANLGKCAADRGCKASHGRRRTQRDDCRNQGIFNEVLAGLIANKS